MGDCQGIYNWAAFPVLIQIENPHAASRQTLGPLTEIDSQPLLRTVRNELQGAFGSGIDRIAMFPALYPILQYTHHQFRLAAGLESLLSTTAALSVGNDFSVTHTQYKPDPAFSLPGLSDLLVLPVYCCTQKPNAEGLFEAYGEENNISRHMLDLKESLIRTFNLGRLAQAMFMTRDELAIVPGARMQSDVISTVLYYSQRAEPVPTLLLTDYSLPIYYDGNRDNRINLIFFSFDTFARLAPREPDEILLINAYSNYLQDFGYYKNLLEFVFSMQVSVHVAKEQQYRWIVDDQESRVIKWLATATPLQDGAYREQLDRPSQPLYRTSEIILTPQRITLIPCNGLETIAYSVVHRTADGRFIHVENIYNVSPNNSDSTLATIQHDAERLKCRLVIKENDGLLINRGRLAGVQPGGRPAERYRQGPALSRP